MAMEYSSITSTILLLFILFISSAHPISGCPSCSPKHGKSHHDKGKKGQHILPPKTPSPVNPPVVVKPPVVFPPVFRNPPVTVPPIVGGGGTPTTPVKGCPTPAPPSPARPSPSPPATETCPIDTLKLGACVDLLGGLVHIGLGDPVVNTCCPLLQGLVELEAAVCLCTTLKVKLLNLNIYLPLALQLLVTCGKTPPPGFTCKL